MRAWIERRRTNRRLKKTRKAYDRLHGRGAVSVPPRSSRGRRSSWDADDIGELIVDILTALPRAVFWLISKILD